MPVDRELNVFSGEEALRAFYDPDAQAPVPVRSLIDYHHHSRLTVGPASLLNSQNV